MRPNIQCKVLRSNQVLPFIHILKLRFCPCWAVSAQLAVHYCSVLCWPCPSYLQMCNHMNEDPPSITAVPMDR
jgi:hypothetical protein